MPEVLEVLVEGGKASTGPPVGPALGPLGLNIMQVVKEINEKTKAFEGMKVPVKLTIDTTTKKYEISVGTPPTSALILKELGIEKGGKDQRSEKVGNLMVEQAKKIALIKRDSVLGSNLKEKVKEIVGTCISMGITVEGKDPREVQREINDGKYDSILTASG
ncbi:MAG: 50S ribosomal protein L11 [Candidatus Altiarchaeales archaeon WOR_SM1_79]|nr:MAG: 50S ribosomal protein L11 [Candidatus Altiarchaeales archaeon WOR_SM1_79]